MSMGLTSVLSLYWLSGFCLHIFEKCPKSPAMKAFLIEGPAFFSGFVGPETTVLTHSLSTVPVVLPLGPCPSQATPGAVSAAPEGSSAPEAVPALLLGILGYFVYGCTVSTLSIEAHYNGISDQPVLAVSHATEIAQVYHSPHFLDISR